MRKRNWVGKYTGYGFGRLPSHEHQNERIGKWRRCDVCCVVKLRTDKMAMARDLSLRRLRNIELVSLALLCVRFATSPTTQSMTVLYESNHRPRMLWSVISDIEHYTILMVVHNVYGIRHAADRKVVVKIVVDKCLKILFAFVFRCVIYMRIAYDVHWRLSRIYTRTYMMRRKMKNRRKRQRNG